MVNHFGLSETDQNEMLPSGKQATYKNRIGWAKVYLTKAGLLESPKRGTFHITQRGIKVLESKPATFRVKDLKQFEAFVDFHQSNKNNKSPAAVVNEDSTDTPEETFEQAYQELHRSLAGELLDQIKANTPEFFEHLVVKLLVKMGYGGSMRDAGKALGRSGDEGVDGIIKEDRLGLGVIYIQAKRWKDSIGRPEIQKFVGALHGKSAKKGVFITTATFTKESINYVSTIDPKVVLIDGARLVELMIDYNLGVSTVESYEIKKIDSDFFIEE